MQGVILSTGTAQGTILGDDGNRYTVHAARLAGREREAAGAHESRLRGSGLSRGEHLPDSEFDPHHARSSSGSACRRTPIPHRARLLRRSALLPRPALLRRSPHPRRRPNREIRPLLRLRQRRDSRWHGGTGPWREAEH